MEVVDFSVPFFYSKLGFFAKSFRKHRGIQAFIETFSLEVWLLLVLVMVLVSGVSAASSTLLLPNKSSKNYISTWLEKLLKLFGNLLSKGTSDSHSSGSMKLLTGFWWVFVIPLTSVYTGTLTSTISIPQKGGYIDTFSELIRHVGNKFWLSVRQGTHEEALFKNPSTEVCAQLSTFTRPRKINITTPRCVTKGRCAMLIDNGLPPWAMDGNYHLASDAFYPFMLGAFFPKGSKLKEGFDIMLERLSEAGLLSFTEGRKMWKMYREVISIPPREGGSFGEKELVEFVDALGLAYVGTLTILSLETIYYQFVSRYVPLC